MANKTFEAYRRHQAPYVEGLKPFSDAFKAAQKKASADWRAMKHEGGISEPRERSNPGMSGLVKAAIVVGVVGGAAYLASKANQPPPKPIIAPASAQNS